MRHRLRSGLAAAAVGLLVLAGAAALAADVKPLLARIKAVGSEGAGNVEASKAWRELVGCGPTAVPAILAALDDADPTAANWLRTAVDAVAERELAAGRSLPAEQLELFVRDTRHSGPGRRLAYELLVRVDPKTPEKLLPGMLNDPSRELRRDAVAVVLKEAQEQLDKQDRPAATTAYQKAFAAAADEDQVELAAKQLKTLGVEVDLAAHYGCVRQWMLVAPFDNTGEAGFKAAYPPEKQVDLAAVYKGKKDAEARWTPASTTDAHGVVDLNKVLGKQKGTIAYAFAVIDSPAERQVEIRAGSVNALKIFLGGKEVFNCEEYHHGMSMDQHRVKVTLKAGRNDLLLKVCQNEQTEDYAQEWTFQARICDGAGGAVPFTVVDAAPKPKEPKGDNQ
jgi:hypothetical protein